MKRKLFLLCAAALLLSDGADARQLDLSRAPTKTATLVSFARQKNFGKSVYSFQHGTRGDKWSKSSANPRALSMKGLPDNAGLLTNSHSGAPQDVQQSSNPFRPAGDLAPNREAYDYRPPAEGGRATSRRFDIRYGGMSWNGTSDWLEVVDRRGTWSVIKDLGALSWSELTSVPVLPPSPVPHDGGVHVRNGRIVAPQNVFVKAVPGHMYVLRIKDEWSDYHVVFRVESLDPGGECTLSWKRVRSPKS